MDSTSLWSACLRFISVGRNVNTFWFRTVRIKQEIIVYEREMLTIGWGLWRMKNMENPPPKHRNSCLFAISLKSNEIGMTQECTGYTWKLQGFHVVRIGLNSPWYKAAVINISRA